MSLITWFKGSGIADVLVAAGVIADGSVKTRRIVLIPRSQSASAKTSRLRRLTGTKGHLQWSWTKQWHQGNRRNPFQWPEGQRSNSLCLYHSWKWLKFLHKTSTHVVLATGRSSNCHCNKCYHGWKYMALATMEDIFYTSLSQLTTWLRSKKLSWKVECLHSRCQGIHIPVSLYISGPSQ